MNAYMFDNGNRDDDWNAVWQAEVSLSDRGWFLEVRIPFSAIRFKPEDDMTWGLQAYRWLHGRGEDTAWVLWDRNASGFVSRWGTLTGLRGVVNPRKLEVLPYFVTKHVDPAAAGGGKAVECVVPCLAITHVELVDEGEAVFDQGERLVHACLVDIAKADEPAFIREFQRDRDRIMHSKAFRRLKHKTQVFLNPEGDHFVTRLTHTVHVNQVGRAMAVSLGLNEALTEAIAQRKVRWQSAQRLVHPDLIDSDHLDDLGPGGACGAE